MQVISSGFLQDFGWFFFFQIKHLWNFSWYIFLWIVRFNTVWGLNWLKIAHILYKGKLLLLFKLFLTDSSFLISKMVSYFYTSSVVQPSQNSIQSWMWMPCLVGNMWPIDTHFLYLNNAFRSNNNSSRFVLLPFLNIVAVYRLADNVTVPITPKVRSIRHNFQFAKQKV